MTEPVLLMTDDVSDSEFSEGCAGSRIEGTIRECSSRIMQADKGLLTQSIRRQTPVRRIAEEAGLESRCGIQMGFEDPRNQEVARWGSPPSWPSRSCFCEPSARRLSPNVGAPTKSTSAVLRVREVAACPWRSRGDASSTRSCALSLVRSWKLIRA